jgi:uncharacterized membrane protein
MISALVVFHVTCGIIAGVAGAATMLSAKGSSRHRLLGASYLVALAGLCGSESLLAAVDWAHRWHLVLLAGAAAAAAGLGRFGARHGRTTVHIAGMSSSYIVMLTAFHVDNGPRLPLWNQLPPIAFWLLPAVVGVPILLRALHRATMEEPA